MKILLNASSAVVGGGVTVLQNLSRALVEVDGGAHRYVIFGATDLRAAVDPGHERVEFIGWQGGRTVLARVFGEQVVLPRVARRVGAHTIFTGGSFGSLGTRIPQVLMVLNAAPFDAGVVASAPTFKARARLRVLRRLGAWTARRAARVIFNSEYSRALMQPVLGVEPARTACIPLGRDPRFAPVATERASAVLHRHGIRSPYLLTVSHFYHYKNYVELVLAFARARAGLPDGVPLVIPSGFDDSPYARTVHRTIGRLGLEPHVRLLGGVPQQDLAALYAAARVFVFTSVCENFPNILVEALASGAPTVTSRHGAMPEIAADAAAYCDPFDPEDIAAAILRLWNDPDEARRLALRGRERVGRYSWPATARALLDVIEAPAG